MLVCGVGDYEWFGMIIDDVIGEVFDKIVKLFGLLYLGGLYVEKMVC